MAKDNFSLWLTLEIEKRGWTNSEVARRGGVSQARVSQVVSGDNPGTEFCIAIARAFGLQPGEILHKAGILDNRLSDAEFETFRAVIAEIPQEQHEHVLAILRTYAKTPVNNNK